MRTVKDVFEAKTGDVEQVAKLQKLVDFAEPILDLVRDTFPTYTLHNRVHAENVLSLMAQLLGDRLTDLSPLEAEILVLGAYFHDIGMVFTPEEKQRIAESDEFQDYLKGNPAAYLTFAHGIKETIDDSVVEGFCRWAHAERVTEWIQKVPEHLLTWGSVSIANALATVCKSHNWPIEKLNDPTLNISFLGTCDLKFCAILLRLADILDFDNSRAPESVYEYLGLATRDSPRKEASDVEWLKHLKSDGFVFPAERRSEYEITINAGPDEPAVESDLRDFLVTIEKEFLECNAILRTCSAKWANLALPGRINRDNIVSNGYTFGDFRFKLDRNAILDLFMGEDLYSEPEVFFRELLQNAIDAVRARCDLERIELADAGYRINITDWLDSEGYQWIKIEDDGIGMDLDIVENYLLRIGSSYYSSLDFQAKLARYGVGQATHRVPISRFGVGLLSTFMVSNQIELSTRRVALQERPPDPLRISFNHLAGFFVVQKYPDNRATRLPDQRGTQDGFRRGSQPGTSIAVKIDPRKYSAEIDIKTLTRKYALASLVPIYVNGERHLDELQLRVRRTEPFVQKLKWESDHETYLHPDLLDVVQKIDLHVFPSNFRLPDGDRRLDGWGFALVVNTRPLREKIAAILPEQLLMLDFDFESGVRPSIRKMLQNPRFHVDIYLDGPESRLSIRITFYRNLAFQLDAEFREELPSMQEGQLKLTIDRFGQGITFTCDASSLLPELGLSADKQEQEMGSSSWSHGGVRLPRSGSSFVSLGLPHASSKIASDLTAEVIGSLWLDDDFRPDLNIARDDVKRVPYQLRSAVELMFEGVLQRAASTFTDTDVYFGFASNFLERLRVVQDAALGDILDDPFTWSSNGWVQQPVFLEHGTYRQLSVETMLEEIARGNRLELQLVADETYALLEAYFEYVASLGGVSVLARRDPNSKVDARLRPYVPSVFVPFSSPTYLFEVVHSQRERGGVQQDFYEYSHANRGHKLVSWFLTVASFLQDRAPGLEADFIDVMTPPSGLFASETTTSPDNLVQDIENCVKRINNMLSGQHVYRARIDLACLLIRTEDTSEEGTKEDWL